jgi:hypothetical protein
MSLFKEIQNDPDVCSNCFRQTHDRIEQNYRLEVYFNEDEGEWDVTPVDVQGVEIELPNGETEVIGGKDDRVYRKPEYTTKMPESGAHRGIRTICQCGYRWGPKREIEEWKNRPLGKKKFFEIAERLLARVREAGATIDEDAYNEKLDAMKSNPDQQFADDRIFDAAVSYAISVASVT